MKTIRAVDLFCAVDNWGLQLAIRTCSADYSHYELAARWSRLGYRSANAILTRGDEVVHVREEEDLFRLIGLPWVPPEKREVFNSPNPNRSAQ
jgi:DNA polymerase/3'-5' exonuclease PolX